MHHRLRTGTKSRPPILYMLGSTRLLKSRTCRSARCVRNHCMTQSNGWHAAPTSVWRSCNVLPSLNVAQSAACGRQLFFSLCLDYICCCSCLSNLKCHSRIAVVGRKNFPLYTCKQLRIDIFARNVFVCVSITRFWVQIFREPVRADDEAAPRVSQL